MNTDSNKIIDSFHREHDYLRISLTEKCNLRCMYCMPEEGVSLKENGKYMTALEIVEIAKVFANLGIKKIRLTGGEPLVRKDVVEIISELAKLPVELAITTNGILVDKHLSLFLDSGLKSINVSLDTLQKNKFKDLTRRNHFDKVMSNIQLLLSNNFHLKLNAVLIKGENDKEILDFVEFTKGRNVHFRFIEFMPFDGNSWDTSKVVSYEDVIQIASNQYGSNLVRLIDKKNDTSKSYKINGYKGTFAVISSVTNPFCDSCNRMRLTADGKIKNCLFSNSEIDLLTPFRNKEKIDILIRQSIWNKKATRAGMNTIQEFSNPVEHSKNRAMISIGG